MENITLHIRISDGKILDLSDDGVASYTDGVETFIIPDNEYISVVYNDKIYKRITDFLQILVSKRGIIADMNSIDTNTPFVRRYINTNKIKRANEAEIDAIVVRAISETKEFLQLTVYQGIILGILGNSLFNLKSNSVETKFDIDVSADYWDIGRIRDVIKASKNEIQDDEFDALIQAEKPEPVFTPTIDRTNKIEILCALATTFVNNNNSIIKPLEPIIIKIMTTMGSEVESEDDFFIQQPT